MVTQAKSVVCSNRHRPRNNFCGRDFNSEQGNVPWRAHVLPGRFTDCSEVTNKHTLFLFFLFLANIFVTYHLSVLRSLASISILFGQVSNIC